MGFDERTKGSGHETTGDFDCDGGPQLGLVSGRFRPVGRSGPESGVWLADRELTTPASPARPKFCLCFAAPATTGGVVPGPIKPPRVWLV